MKKTILLIAIMVMALGLVGAVSAQCDINVPTGGSIQAAINAASPGETICVAAGTYNENIIVSKTLTLLGPNAGINPNTGTRAAEAVIEKDTVPGGYWLGIVNLNADNIVFDGFEVKSPSKSYVRGIEIHDADYVTIKNTKIHHIQDVLIYPNLADWLLVENCELYDNEDEAIKVASTIPGGHNCFDVTIRNNNFHNTDRGIWVYKGGRWTIENNVFCNLYDFAINVDSYGGHIVRYNTICNVGKAGIKAEKTSIITHNTIVGVTGSSSSYYGAGIAVKSGFSGGVIKDNVIVLNKKGIYQRSAPAVITIDYNNVWGNTYGNYVGFTPGPNDISLDPLFSGVPDFAACCSYDLCPTASSPVVNVASDGTNIGSIQAGDCAPSCTDIDGDGYGAVGTDISGCPNPGYDCNDGDPSQYPGTTKVTDPNLPWDSIGECKVEISQCNGTTGYYVVIQNKVTPQPEVCDNKDNDCDGSVDDVDADNDGVNDCVDDSCLGTTHDTIIRLDPNHHIYDGRFTDQFTTNAGSSKKPIYRSSYTMQETRGCSCTQILDAKPGKDKGEYNFACSKGTMDNWIGNKGWVTGAAITSVSEETTWLGMISVVSIIALAVVSVAAFNNLSKRKR